MTRQFEKRKRTVHSCPSIRAKASPTKSTDKRYRLSCSKDRLADSREAGYFWLSKAHRAVPRVSLIAKRERHVPMTLRAKGNACRG
jgi:hypothetical protein